MEVPDRLASPAWEPGPKGLLGAAGLLQTRAHFAGPIASMDDARPCKRIGNSRSFAGSAQRNFQAAVTARPASR